MYFRNYGLPKTWLDKCLKVPFRVSDKKQHGECPQTLFKFERYLLCHIY